MELLTEKIAAPDISSWRGNDESELIVLTKKNQPAFDRSTTVWRALMSIEKATLARPARVIVVGNEKGGSGKSTVAMHIAMALISQAKASPPSISIPGSEASPIISRTGAPGLSTLAATSKFPTILVSIRRSIIRLRRTRPQHARHSARPSMHWRKATALL